MNSPDDDAHIYWTCCAPCPCCLAGFFTSLALSTHTHTHKCAHHLIIIIIFVDTHMLELTNVRSFAFATRVSSPLTPSPKRLSFQLELITCIGEKESLHHHSATTTTTQHNTDTFTTIDRAPLGRLLYVARTRTIIAVLIQHNRLPCFMQEATDESMCVCVCVYWVVPYCLHVERALAKLKAKIERERERERERENDSWTRRKRLGDLSCGICALCLVAVSRH